VSFKRTAGPVDHQGMGDLAGAVSLIVPTRNEAGNVSELLVRLGRLPAGVLREVIFVDDSDDDTPAAIAYLAGSVDFPVAVVHREAGLRTGGLSGAVVEGFRRAGGEWLAVMDADLQHPPEVLGDMFATGESAGADIVCATRNVSGGGRDGLGAARDVISKSFAAFARRAFPRRLRGVSDPMSGFFLVRRSALDPEALNPTGFKILLEILVRTPGLRRAEVGYEFAPRHAGDSKASLREGVTYLRHLARLRLAA
jgi:dolichol-phosphate mannosyltransferase